MTEYTYSRNHWNRSFLFLFFDKHDNTVFFQFKFFDYKFGPANENGYLEWCNFYFSMDGVNFYCLMSAETKDQKHENWSWVDMKRNLPNTELMINGCFEPTNNSMWDKNVPNQRVKVYDESNKAILTVTWFLNEFYREILFIRIIGKWHVNGIYPSEFFNENYSLLVKSYLKSSNLNGYSTLFKTEKNTSVSKNNEVKVSQEEDAIVIKGADFGENIKVYTTSGAEVKSIVTNNEVVKIKLPVNQMYIVNIGQSRYKVAL